MAFPLPHESGAVEKPEPFDCATQLMRRAGEVQCKRPSHLTAPSWAAEPVTCVWVRRLGRVLQELQRQADLEVHLCHAPHVRLLSLHPPWGKGHWVMAGVRVEVEVSQESG